MTYHPCNDILLTVRKGNPTNKVDNDTTKVVLLSSVYRTSRGITAQLVEQRTENPRVTGSIPVLGIPRTNKYAGVVQW